MFVCPFKVKRQKSVVDILLLLSVLFKVKRQKNGAWSPQSVVVVCLFVFVVVAVCLFVFVVVAGNDDVDDDMEEVREEHSWRRWSLTMLMKRREEEVEDSDTDDEEVTEERGGG